MSTSFFVFRHKRRVKGVLQESRTYSGRLKLAGETKTRHVVLGVTDKRVAEQKLAEIVRDLERESFGLVVPRSIREAFAAPFTQHVERFLDDIKGKGRAYHTVTHYRTLLRVLTRECKWKTLRDVTARSFCDWRLRSKRSPKYHNDLHGVASGLLTWLERQELLLSNPFKHVEKVSNASPGGYRRALSALEIPRLLAVAPPQRAWVYLVILYTGLRRHELNRLTWADFQLDTPPHSVALSARITKNRKPAVLGLRPEVVEALRRHRPLDSMPFEWAFRGKVPAVSSLHRDLAAAGIPVVDERGRRLDVHALRTTYGTMLSASGVAPRVAMELMRHSDIRLTMRVYTDAAQLPLTSEMDKLPSYSLPKSDTLHDTLTDTFTGVAACHGLSHTVKVTL